ncbi:MAG: hypothetical protein ABSE46_23420 [Terracidiphilus sp.]
MLNSDAVGRLSLAGRGTKASNELEVGACGGEEVRTGAWGLKALGTGSACGSTLRRAVTGDEGNGSGLTFGAGLAMKAMALD